MADLGSLIVCPVCHTDLPLETIRAEGSACCPRCGRRYTSWLGRYQTLIKKGVNSLSRHEWLATMGLRRFIFYMVSVARMKVPEGAIDYFHFVHLNVAAVSGWLTELNLTITRQQEYPAADSVFIRAIKIN